MTKIVHLISTLDRGGAETSLYRLITGMDKYRLRNIVVSLKNVGPVGKEIQKNGISVFPLNMQKGLPDPRGILSFNRILQEFRPDIIQCWLYHANLFGVLFKQRVRAEWCTSEKSILIGMVGRMIPKKDQETFLKAAHLIKDMNNIYFVCVGEGDSGYQGKLIELSKALDLEKKVIWAGLRKDMPFVYNALNILTLSSAYGEGFPNVVGEAMACKVPCVATDTGDAVQIVGKFGFVVPPKDPQALAEGWKKILTLPEKELNILRNRARDRIINNFNTHRFVERTTTFLRSVAFSHQAP